MNKISLHKQNRDKNYDCTKVMDFIHEYERICETFNTCNGCPVNYCCNYSILSLLNTAKNKDLTKVISTVQEWSDTHPEKLKKERPALTENDITVLKALQIMGYHWITKDEDGSTPCAFITKPKKYRENGYWDSNCTESVINYDFPFLSWKDEEPTNIDWLLENDNVDII